MNKIKEYRANKKLTIRELAKKSKISVGYLSDLENAKVDNPSKCTMEKIATALGKTVPEVFYPNN